MAESNSTPTNVADLLDIERAHARQLWSILSEVRQHDQVPRWVLKSFPEAGTEAQWDAMDVARRAVDEELGEYVQDMPLADMTHQMIQMRGASTHLSSG